MFTSIPKDLRDTLGEKAAESLAKMLSDYGNYVEGSIINQSEYRFENALTQNSSSLRQEMAGMRSDLREEMTQMKSELRSEMGEIRSELHDEMTQMKSELRSEMGEIRSELHDEMTQMKSELRSEMGEIKNDLLTRIKTVESNLEVTIAKNNVSTIRWMFIFWVGQIGAVTSVLFVFFR